MVSTRARTRSCWPSTRRTARHPDSSRCVSGCRPPTITKTINRLQTQGFLEKRASETDARQAHIFLTVRGRDAIRDIEKSVRKTEKTAFKGIDKKDQKTLIKLLSRVELNLSDVPAAATEDDDDSVE